MDECHTRARELQKARSKRAKLGLRHKTIKGFCGGISPSKKRALEASLCRNARTRCWLVTPAPSDMSVCFYKTPSQHHKQLQLTCYLSSVTLQETIFSMPQAESTFTITVLPASKLSNNSFTTFLSSSVGSPMFVKVGKFRSSLVSPLSKSKLTSPVSGSAFRS